MWDHRGGSITRVAETLIISVSQPSEAAVWSDGPVTAAGCGEGAECRTPEGRTPTAGLGVCSGGSPPGSGTWLGGDSDSVGGLSSEAPAAAPAAAPASASAATGGDGIQVICRFDSPPRPPSPPSSPPPYPPPPPPTESPPTLAALSREVSEFSSIIEIDGDSFCIRSRLAGREEPEAPSSPSTARRDTERDGDDSDSDSDGSDSEDEVAALVAECRRFNESRLLPRWPALLPTDDADADVIDDETTSSREEEEEDERTEEEEDRPTSVDSGRESGTDSRTADSEEGDAKQTEPPTLQTQIQAQTEAQTEAQTQTPLEVKMALLRREVVSTVLAERLSIERTGTGQPVPD